MFGAALIIFRETVEAALFVSIMAAATQGLPGRGRWLGIGIAAGVIGSLVVAALMEPIAEMAEGIGQEYLNAGILATAFVMLGWHVMTSARHGMEAASAARQLGASLREGSRTPWALVIAVALAVLREGAETVLFIAGYATGNASSQASILIGCAFGLVAGIALGGVLYAGLKAIPIRKLFTVTNTLILLLAAAMASQLARTLIQAGTLPSLMAPIWDTSAFISSESLPGTLLKALIGYDARPSAMQAIFYVGGIVLLLIGMRLMRPAPRLGQARPVRG
ncbi:high-affinity iron transporter [Noviherbaspirillum humi]|uniref:High-affinity iron transporter n=1 Tax=Noviherbaspirillum humi TaxID=1688639 RepID=A0A239J524_9BURK|nr:FTR1 family protein [Noviherbaspirillum humi]SNT00588.1 high-affinity iron transporter [Noviherbaspirillum humi]